MKVFIGADHNGYELKEKLEKFLISQGHSVADMGDEQFNPEDDFPQYAGRVVSAMLGSEEKDPMGILICGSGQGMCMAANRFKGIRASLIWNKSEAKSSRNDDNSNVLCLPAHEITDFDQVTDLVTTWINTPFAAAPRYIRRLHQLDELN